jgi:acyl-CoA thioesterase-1
MTQAPRSLLYAALGDSTGVGVGALDGRGYVARLFERLSRISPQAQLMNACVSGAQSADAVARQLPRVLAAKPALITVFIGINDLIRAVAVDRYGENIEHIARSLADVETRALFCTIPDLAHAPAAQTFLSALGVQRSLFETRTLALNARILECARRHGHATQDLFGVTLRDKEHFFSRDGFHPSSQGYEELAEQLWPAFEQLANSVTAPRQTT